MSHLVIPAVLPKGESIFVTPDLSVQPHASGDRFDFITLEMSLLIPQAGHNPLILDGEIPAGATDFTFNIRPFQTETLTTGSYGYYIFLESIQGQKLGIANGVTDVIDYTAPGPSYIRELITVLKETILNKMKGRADIKSYSIGDRDVATMSLAELRIELERAEEQLARSIHGKQYWRKGFDIN